MAVGVPAKISTSQMRAVVRRYQNGEGLAGLAADIGCRKATLRARLVEAGVPIRNRSEFARLGWDGRRTMRVSLTCKRCAKPFTRRPHEIERGRDAYCSASCRTAADRTSVIRQCQHCNANLVAERGSVVRGKRKFCDDDCYKASLRGKSRVLSSDQIAYAVAQYAGGESATPIAAQLGCHPSTVLLALKNADVPIRKFTSPPRALRCDLPIAEIVALYRAGESTLSLGARYGVCGGTIHRRLIRAGVKIRGGRLGSGYHIRCLDGHIVRSHAERQVDDWLYSQGIVHAYEATLPFHRTWTADFYAGGHYVEVWGIKNRARYDERRAEKIAGYELAELPVISLEARDIDAGCDLAAALRPLTSPERRP